MAKLGLYRKLSESDTHVVVERSTFWNWVFLSLILLAAVVGLSLSPRLLGLLVVIWFAYVFAIYRPAKHITDAIKAQSRRSGLNMTGRPYSFTNPATYKILKTEQFPLEDR